MQRQAAETIALQALAWIAADDEMAGAFLSGTGATAGEIAERAGDPDFLVAVLDFLTADDRTVAAFCDAAGLGYDAPLAARRAIPGGEEVHWT